MIKNNDYLNRRWDGDSLVNLHSLECTAQESPTSTKLGNFKPGLRYQNQFRFRKG